MTCVLAVRTVYNRPCVTEYMKQEGELQIPEVGSGRSHEDCGNNWVSTSSGSCYRYGVPESSRSGYGLPESRSQGSSVCRVDVSSTSSVTLGSRCADVSYCPRTSETLNGMRNNSQAAVADPQTTRQGVKRKAEFVDPDDNNAYIPPKRVSPFLNTPKERKEELKKVLKISIQKLKQVDDPEHFLRRSVLVNNTMKKLQTELREEKMKQTKSYSATRRKERSSYSALNNNCLSNSYLFDDPFLCDVYEKITDDMTDTLVSNLQDKLIDSTSDIVLNKADDVTSASPVTSACISSVGISCRTSDAIETNVGSSPATSACTSSVGIPCRTSDEIGTETGNGAPLTNQRITTLQQRFERESSVPDVVQCNRVTGPSLVTGSNDRLTLSSARLDWSQSNEFNDVQMCDSSTSVINVVEPVKLRQSWACVQTLCEGGATVTTADARRSSVPDDNSHIEDISHFLCSIDSLTGVSQSKSAASQHDLSSMSAAAAAARPSAALDSIMGLDSLTSITMKDFILAQ